MYKYKLVKKINPQDKAAPKKWYAIPISEVPQTVKAMTRAATENTHDTCSYGKHNNRSHRNGSRS